MPQTDLHSLEEFRQALAARPASLLFKHSPICPVSHAAHEQWERFRSEHPDVPTLFVDVIADRPVARGLATAVGVPHASPQAILFVGGEAVWDASHGDVLAPELASAWERHGAGA
jgi:bacillithiol system protein YtxJ